LRVEVAHVDWSKEPWPSRATLAEVAKAGGKSREMVRRCRSRPDYQQGFVWLFVEERLLPVLEISAEAERTERLKGLPQRLQKGRSKRQGDPLQRSVAKYERDAALYVALKSHWSGPIKSMLNGKTYYDPASYFEHIASCPSHVWVGDEDEQL
jgi:hypothetical protein